MESQAISEEELRNVETILKTVVSYTWQSSDILKLTTTIRKQQKKLKEIAEQGIKAGVEAINLAKEHEKVKLEIGHLNRLMPHIGMNCKFQNSNEGEYRVPNCSVAIGIGIICFGSCNCSSGKWELKD